MGTKVQCKSYLPGYYSMRDLNEDANSGSWPLYYENKTLKSGHCYNGFSSRPTTDGYLGYDKEVLKQTMLMHESIFRKQVYELHRLYKIQKSLMDELRMKELHKYTLPVETTQSSLFSSQLSSEDAQKTRHIPSLPLVNSACSKPSVCDSEKTQPPFSFRKENGIHTCPAPTQKGSSSKDKLSESSSKKFPRKMFDLQLPADEYIDSEEGEPLEEEKASEISVVTNYPLRNSGAAHDRDVKLSLGSGGNPGSQADSLRSDSCLQSTHHGLADLNEPIPVEEEIVSAPVDFLHPVTCHGEIKGQSLPITPNSGFHGSSRDFFQDKQKGRDNETSSNSQRSENERSRQEWPPNLEAGQSNCSLKSLPQGFYPEKLPAPSAPFQFEHKKALELPSFVLSDQSKREPWREKTSYSLESSQREQNLQSFNFLGSVADAHVPGLHPSIPQSDVANSGSSLASSWRKPTSSLIQKKPIAVQELSSVNPFSPMSKNSKTSYQGSGVIEDKWHLNSNFGSNPSFGSEISNGKNGFCHGSQSESKLLQVCSPSVGFGYLNCSIDNTSAYEHFGNHGLAKHYKGSDSVDVKIVKDINLNMVLPNGFQDMVLQRDLVIIDGEGKHEDPPGGLPWLGAKPACNDTTTKGSRNLDKTGSDSLQVCPQHFADEVEARNGRNPSFIQDFTLASCTRYTEAKIVKMADSPSDKKILGFPIFDKPHVSHNHSSSQCSSAKLCHHRSEIEDIENNVKVKVLNIDLSHNPSLPNSRDQLSMENLVVEKRLSNNLDDSRNRINLNSCADEDESLSVTNVQCGAEKRTTGIDLEVLAVPESEEGIPTGGEFLSDQLESLVQSSRVVGDPHEELVKTAAEAIVAISSFSNNKHSEDDICQPSETPLKETLHWFAEIISSNMGDLQSYIDVALRCKGVSDQESSSDESDYFETMTLKLTELEVEERWCKPHAPEIPKVEEASASRLLSRPRKGQGRRGRQRRDFQRDILPGLASLSRHEVNEDLQTIEGLMRATGCSWETGLAKKNAGRSGWARGRRRSRCPAPTMVMTVECPPPKQQSSNGELGLEERSLTGWGKTTRRPRRQRCPAGNPPLPVAIV
ncbi:PREDICTED: uncharacterized protein LOC104598504 [Nelumbo nucifera]|uniref:Uncharacterized protein LOC104598504 n=1 Tax=Nelumbo nucifera TaxID=4432 RepID=A0A1U8A2B7_NELNU|nr:PREDICTED: uncharacterized protein LOC104598504 [Nelumbo nucifera]